ncbi:TolC family protein [Idiomarina loihiensis]|uniref:TolC family protein n=2 Tax=Idiomarina TaxID=135575 RepID=UPI0031598721
MSFTNIKGYKIFTALFVFCFLNTSFAESKLPSTNQQLLDSTIQHIQSDGLKGVSQFSQRNWLASTPHLSLMRWQTSDEVIGSDETELLLQLDLLSPSYQNLIRESDALNQKFSELQRQQLELTASSLLRNLFWQSKRVNAGLAYDEKSVSQLSHLLAATQKQVKASEIPAYDAIIVEQRLNTYRATLAEKQIQLQQLTRLWQQYTGQRAFPEQLSEPQTHETLPLRHPSLRTLTMQWRLLLLQTKKSSAEQKQWTATAGYKHINAMSGSENQVGFGLSLPLGFSDSLSALELNSLKQQQNALMNETRQTKVTIELRIAEAVSQVEQFKQKLKQSQQNAELSKTAIDQLNQLYQQRQLDTRMFVDRLLEQLNYQREKELTQIQLQYAFAELNQAKGIPL